MERKRPARRRPFPFLPRVARRSSGMEAEIDPVAVGVEVAPVEVGLLVLVAEPLEDEAEVLGDGEVGADAAAGHAEGVVAPVLQAREGALDADGVEVDAAAELEALAVLAVDGGGRGEVLREAVADGVVALEAVS